MSDIIRRQRHICNGIANIDKFLTLAGKHEGWFMENM